MRRRPERLALALELQPQRTRLERGVAFRAQLAALDHLGQHGIAPLQRPLGVEHRVVVAVALEHADQRGALQQVEPVGRAVEIGSRRHLDAVGVVEEGHGVEIGLQDLVLRVDRLDLERRDRFLQLARQRRCAADLLGIEVARELLRQRRAALAVAAQGMQRRGRRAPPVEPEMLAKTVVLGRDQGIDHMRCHVLEFDPDPVRTLELGQPLAVGAHDLGRLLGRGLADVADRRRERDQQQRIQQQQGRQRGQRQQGTAPAQPPRQTASRSAPDPAGRREAGVQTAQGGRDRGQRVHVGRSGAGPSKQGRQRRS